MYTTEVAWHTKHWGPPNEFGYKDFIPLFHPTKFDPDEWIQLFQQAGARYMCPVAEHHTFMYPAPGVPNDEFDPRYAGFYGPPHAAITSPLPRLAALPWE